METLSQQEVIAILAALEERITDAWKWAEHRGTAAGTPTFDYFVRRVEIGFSAYQKVLNWPNEPAREN